MRGVSCDEEQPPCSAACSSRTKARVRVGAKAEGGARAEARGRGGARAEAEARLDAKGGRGGGRARRVSRRHEVELSRSGLLCSRT